MNELQTPEMIESDTVNELPKYEPIIIDSAEEQEKLELGIGFSEACKEMRSAEVGGVELDDNDAGKDDSAEEAPARNESA